MIKNLDGEQIEKQIGSEVFVCWDSPLMIIGRVASAKNGQATVVHPALIGGGSIRWSFRYDKAKRKWRRRFTTAEKKLCRSTKADSSEMYTISLGN